MDSISYKTVSGKSFQADDGNMSLPFFLRSAELNNASATYQRYTRIGHDGEAILEGKLNPLPITLEIGVSGENTDQLKENIKKVLTSFLLLEEGLLTYTKQDKSYEINCFVGEAPSVTLHHNLYAVVTILLTAPFPFWRTAAEDITIFCEAGKSASITFNSETQYKVPAALYVSCTSTMAGTATESAIITLSGVYRDALWNRITATGTKKPVDVAKVKTAALYVAKNMTAGNTIWIDWGLQGRFYTDTNDEIDFIRSSIQYVYPGSNTLTLSVKATTGELSAVLRRYDYVKVVM